MASSFPAPAPTKHLLFRPLHPTDAPRLASIANCPSISKWMLNTFPSPYTLSSAEGFIARCALPVDETKSVDWAICLHSLPLPGSEPDPEPPLIGVCGLKLGSDVHAHQAIVGYWISPAYQGRKFGREMLAGLVEWAWRTEGLVRAREGGVEVDGEGKPVMLGRLAAEVFGGNDASSRHEGHTRLKALVSQNI
ncbi:acyl-CoA N-acyltransferase [Trichodelitschia bisporula]|uniref:Acyl-CoA N-acyltransferase n=1 Tax=Trichodelitschia bisporula TaxID=703511 RepID=A0A6G1HZ54_9PEZI|nr:acyl-CoA N-acyltransferase [Trichodelitschia bisporula]